MRRGLPISVNWTFFARCYIWGATRVSWPKISGRRGRPPATILLFQKTRINDLSYSIKIWTDFSFVLSCVWRTGRQTDRHTEFSSLDHVWIPCSAVKIITPTGATETQQGSRPLTVTQHLNKKTDAPCERLPLVLVAVVLSLSVISAARDVVPVHVLGVSWKTQPVDGSPPTEECSMHQTEDAVVSSRLLMFPLPVNDSVELACVA